MSDKSDAELHAVATAVSTREDFANFVRLLGDNFSHHPEDWENDTLPRFLEAMSAWISDMGAALHNQGRVLPDEPTWQMFAEILRAAQIYE